MAAASFRPATGVPSYDRASFSRLTPVIGARSGVEGAHVLVEAADAAAVETFSPGGPRLVFWIARSSKPLRLSGLSARGFDGRVHRGTAMVVAPNSQTTWEAPEGSPGSVHVALDPARLETILQDSFFSRPPVWRSVELVRDDTLRRLGDVLEEEMKRPEGGCALFLSSIVTAAAAHAIRAYGPESPQQTAFPKLRLPDWRVRRVIDQIENRLGESMTLAELAASVGLSSAHFSRAFRATLGMTPHAFVTRRRVETAERHLRESALSIASIAVMCGFASQAHMTEVFRKELGVTPGRYRRNFRGEPGRGRDPAS